MQNCSSIGIAIPLLHRGVWVNGTKNSCSQRFLV